MAKVFSKISHVKELIARNNIKIVKVYSDEKTLIENTSDNNFTPEQNIEFLEQLLESLEGEYVLVKLFKGEKDGYPLQHYIKLTGETTSKAEPAQQPNNMVIGLIQQMNELKIEMVKAEHKRELEKFAEELSRLKAKNEKKPNPMVEQLLKVGTDLLLKNKTAAPAPAAPAPVVEVIRTAPAPAPSPGIFGTGEKEKFTNLVTRWKKADADFITALEKVVVLAEENPEMYKMLKAQ